MGKGQINRIDLTGRRFSRLVVLTFAQIGANHNNCSAYWLCRCDCGNEKVIKASELKRGATTSCGCFSKEVSAARLIVHGLHSHRFYATWSGMMARCYNPKAHGYYRYGGRGVRVCDEWHDLATFLKWCDQQNPAGGLSLDRFPDKAGNYSPSNCRFATWSEQNRNRRPFSEWNWNDQRQHESPSCHWQ